MKCPYPGDHFPQAPSDATCVRCGQLYKARGRPVGPGRTRRKPPPLLPAQPGDRCPVCTMGRMRFHDPSDQRSLNCHVCTHEAVWEDAPEPTRLRRGGGNRSRDNLAYLRGTTYLRKAGYTVEQAGVMTDEALREIPRIGPEFIRLLRLRYGERLPLGRPIHDKVRPSVGLTDRW